MPYISPEGDFERIFMTSSEFVDRFVGSSSWTWGDNSNGRLGDGTTTTRSSPVTTAGGGTNWKQVAAGGAHTAAIKTDGTLWTWGSNGSGRLGDGTTNDRSSPGTVSGGGTNWNQVACGYDHTASIKTDGTLWTWGDNGSGQLGTGTTTARSSPGTVAGGGTNWKQVACGRVMTAAVKTDGTLWTWGGNGDGQLGDGTTTARSSPGTTAGGGTNWKQVATGGGFLGISTAAVKTDGTLWTWGTNNTYQLGTGNTVNRSSPGTTAGGGTNWKQVSVGALFMAAIKTDGTLLTWGYNLSGELGGSGGQAPGIVAGGGTNWKQVACGYRHAGAVKTDGTLWVWGRNAEGQLGDGTTSNKSSPIQPTNNLSNWKQVSGGSTHTVAVAQN